MTVEALLPVIWLIGGTSEAPMLARKLIELNYRLVVTTTTSEGANLLRSHDVKVQIGALNRDGMEDLITEEGIQLVVDASHPYATLVSENAMAVCARLDLPYIRFERPELDLPTDPLIRQVSTMEAAANLAFELGSTVFTTIGVKDLAVFVQKRDILRNGGQENIRLIAKVLPALSSIQTCQDLGLELKDVFAMYGTVSTSFYQEIIREYKIDVMISKESGETGGVLEKIEACLALEKPLIIVSRPKLQYLELVSSLVDLEDKLEKVGAKCQK